MFTLYKDNFFLFPSVIFTVSDFSLMYMIHFHLIFGSSCFFKKYVYPIAAATLI